MCERTISSVGDSRCQEYTKITLETTRATSVPVCLIRWRKYSLVFCLSLRENCTCFCFFWGVTFSLEKEASLPLIDFNQANSLYSRAYPFFLNWENILQLRYYIRKPIMTVIELVGSPAGRKRQKTAGALSLSIPHSKLSNSRPFPSITERVS